MVEMTKRERVMAAIRGEPVDRVPASFFGHNHAVEYSSDLTAQWLLEQNSKFEWDFIKVHLRGSYFGEAWGCEYRVDLKTNPMIVKPIIKNVSDFRKLERQDPTKGVLGDQVKVARMLGETLKGRVPYVQTIFCPLTVAGKLAGSAAFTASESELIKSFIKEDPEALHYGLSVISQTLADYSREVIRAGADGVFFATVFSRDVLTEKEYATFGRPYDLAVLEAANQEGATCNILHLCRNNIMFDFLSDYPVRVINYDNFGPDNPSLREAMGKTDKALWGGVHNVNPLLEGSVKAIEAQVHEALDQTGGRRFLLGPTCSALSTLSPDDVRRVPEAHFRAAKEALSNWKPN